MLVALQIGDAMPHLPPAFECSPQRRVIAAGKAVEQRQSRSRIERQHRFVLRMNYRQVRSKLFEHRHRCRLIVDEDAAFAACRDFAPQNDLLVFAIDPVGFEHRRNRRRIGIKHSRDGRSFRSVPDRIAGCFIAQQQRQCVDENGFARAGFAGQQIQTSAKFHGDVVDDRVVFDPQFEQHSEVSLLRSLAGKMAAVSCGRSSPFALRFSPER